MSVPAFALAVLEEFIIIGIVTVWALTLQWYNVWIAVFSGFSLHILIHIGQWMIVRKYIPIIITSLLSIPYIIWGINSIVRSFAVIEIVTCFIAGVFVAVLNLFFAHKLASKFDRYMKNNL